MRSTLTSGSPLALAWAFLLGLCLLSTGCRDPGRARYQEALRQYEVLVNAHRPPWDKSYGEVKLLLQKVPRDSRARPDADRLLLAINLIQGQRPPPPLATMADRNETNARAVAQRADCALKARALGLATPAQREDIRRKLQECQAALERLIEAAESTH